MAWVRCRKCDRRVSDKKRKCPRCGTVINKKNNNINYMNVFKSVTLLAIEVLLVWLVIMLGKEVLYFGEVKPLFLLFGSIVLLTISSVINFKYILKRLRGIYYVLVLCIITLSLGVIAGYGFKGIEAFQNENSLEIYNLATKYSLKDAKHLKREIDKIFEIDDEVSVRNVTIGNYYKDGDEYILYLDDFYGNYRLKFHILMSDNNIKDIYWLFNEHKLFLFENGKKSDDFSYYYAMYVVENLMGENVKGLAKIEDDVEKIVMNRFVDYANIMVSYDGLEYDAENNVFKYKCVAQKMNYHDEVEDEEFTISFKKIDQEKNKKVWYYGDASFDYVDWKVEFQ